MGIVKPVCFAAGFTGGVTFFGAGCAGLLRAKAYLPCDVAAGRHLIKNVETSRVEIVETDSTQWNVLRRVQVITWRKLVLVELGGWFLEVA